jgi:hypothetical protein
VPDENFLRDEFAKTTAPNTLDATRIIARSRARRVPRQIAAGAVGALAIVGITVVGLQVTQAHSPVTMTAGEAYDQSAPAGPEISAIKRAPADKINLCTGTLAEVAPSQYGLRLDVTLPLSVDAGTGAVAAIVRLTNTSASEVIGSTPASPALTLSQDGVVLWHSNGPTDYTPVAVDLAPGASVDYSASFVAVRCGVDDDSAESFGTDLPALEPGTYQLSALMDFTADPAMAQLTTELDLVSGPVSTLEIR